MKINRLENWTKITWKYQCQSIQKCSKFKKDFHFYYWKSYKIIFIGPNTNDIRGPDEPNSMLDMVDRISLRFSTNLHNVNWANIIEQTLPYANNHRKNTIRHASGKYSINPVLLLSKWVQDQKEISHIFQRIQLWFD